MRVILFIDLLGARANWKRGGVIAATEAFQRFTNMFIAAIRVDAASHVVGGGIETDAAMFVFDSATAALTVARRLFLWAFDNANNPEATRLWLRGSLVPCGDEVEPRRQSLIGSSCAGHVFTYTPAALDAISIEKSGFKGMRLVVRADAIDEVEREQMKVTMEECWLSPFKHLRYSSYPQTTGVHFEDFLWMVCSNEEQWRDLSLHMTSRLRHSSCAPEEFVQAAATQVVFHEVAAVRQSVISQMRRARRAAEGDEVGS